MEMPQNNSRQQLRHFKSDQFQAADNHFQFTPINAVVNESEVQIRDRQTLLQKNSNDERKKSVRFGQQSSENPISIQIQKAEIQNNISIPQIIINKVNDGTVKNNSQQETSFQNQDKLEESRISDLSSSEEDLPYPYNTLATDRNKEIQSQLKVVNSIIKRQKFPIDSQAVKLNKDSTLHEKIYAARLLFKPQPSKVKIFPIKEDDPFDFKKTLETEECFLQNAHHENPLWMNLVNSEVLASKASWNLGQHNQPPRVFNVMDRKIIEDYMSRKRTINDPFRCSPIVQAKWKLTRNVIALHVRMMMIYKEMALFGTSERRLDISRGIQKIRDFMVPDPNLKNPNLKRTLSHSNNEPDCMMIRNGSTFHKFWGIVIIILLIYTAVVMPYRLALMEDDTDILFFYIDTVVDFIFIIDIIINFNLPLERPYESEPDYNRKRITINYIVFWFWIDLLASIPINLIMKIAIKEESSLDLSGQRLIRMARLPRLYRLLRTIRLFKIVRLFKNSEHLQNILAFFKMNNAALRLSMFFVSVVFFVHLSGCLWIIVAQLNDFNPDTWISRSGLQDQSDTEKYTAAIYWAIQTLLTVGYGDISAVTTEEMVMAVSWMILGGFFYTFTIGNLTSVLSNQNSRQSQIRDKIQAISQFCKESNIDRQLSVKMRNAVYYTANKNYIWTDKQKIFEELPASIKCEIALEMYFGVIKKIRFFDDKDNNLIGSIVPLLTPTKAAKYEYIYRKNSHPHAIYFITRGRVSFYLQRKGLAFKDMIEGGYFGDMDIIFQRKRRYTMISTTDSDFLIMTKQILEEIIVKEYPEVYEEMQLVAFERDRRVKAAKQIALVEYNEMIDQQGFNYSPYQRYRQLKTEIRNKKRAKNRHSREKTSSLDIFNTPTGLQPENNNNSQSNNFLIVPIVQQKEEITQRDSQRNEEPKIDQQSQPQIKILRLPTMNDDDQVILNQVKSQRSLHGRINPQTMQQLMKDKQKIDMLSDTSSSMSSSDESQSLQSDKITEQDKQPIIFSQRHNTELEEFQSIITQQGEKQAQLEIRVDRISQQMSQIIERLKSATTSNSK